MGNPYAKAVEQGLKRDPQKHAVGPKTRRVGTDFQKTMLKQKTEWDDRSKRSHPIGKPVAKMPLRSQMKARRAICPEFLRTDFP
jgi:hypothetical protein